MIYCNIIDNVKFSPRIISLHITTFIIEYKMLLFNIKLK